MLQMMKTKLKNKKGFTLMEMLIVVAIIAILLAIAIPAFSGALTEAKIKADQANVRAWYAEQMANNMTKTTPAFHAPGSVDLAVEKITLQMAEATMTVKGTTAEDFSVTYDNKAKNGTITFGE